MAIHAHSTPVPAPQRGLLRAFANPRDLAANHREIPGSCPPTGPLADLKSTVAQPCNASGLAPEEALASTAAPALSPAPLPSLTSAFSRRRAIFGAVALAAAPVAIAPAAAVAGDFPSTDKGMSVEAAELQLEFETTAKRHRRALQRCDEADAAMVWPEIPEALFWKPADRAFFAFSLPGQERCSGRRWWGFSDDLEGLQARQLAFVNGSPIRDSRARRDEIVTADCAYRAAVAAAELAAGMPAAEAEYEEAAGAFFDFTDRLIALRTDDPAMMGLKALALVEVARRQGGHDKLIERTIADESNQAMCLGASLLRDFIEQIGAAHREVAYV